MAVIVIIFFLFFFFIASLTTYNCIFYKALWKRKKIVFRTVCVYLLMERFPEVEEKIRKLWLNSPFYVFFFFIMIPLQLRYKPHNLLSRITLK